MSLIVVINEKISTSQTDIVLNFPLNSSCVVVTFLSNSTNVVNGSSSWSDSLTLTHANFARSVSSEFSACEWISPKLESTCSWYRNRAETSCATGHISDILRTIKTFRMLRNIDRFPMVIQYVSVSFLVIFFRFRHLPKKWMDFPKQLNPKFKNRKGESRVCSSLIVV